MAHEPLREDFYLGDRKVTFMAYVESTLDDSVGLDYGQRLSFRPLDGSKMPEELGQQVLYPAIKHLMGSKLTEQNIRLCLVIIKSLLTEEYGCGRLYWLFDKWNWKP